MKEDQKWLAIKSCPIVFKSVRGCIRCSNHIDPVNIKERISCAILSAIKTRSNFGPRVSSANSVCCQLLVPLEQFNRFFRSGTILSVNATSLIYFILISPIEIP